MTRKLKFVTQPASIIQVEILPLDNNNKTMTIFFAIVALWVSVFCTTEAFSSPTFGTLQQQQRQRFASSLMSAASETQQQEEVESPSQQQQLTLFSPCKINLFLRIIRKREDGYHDLASLFQAIGFGDTLHLQVLQEDDDDETEITEDTFTCNMPGVPTDQSNLVLRALTLMREKTGQKVYFNADLIKECPAQAGLGGGSANAATAMFGANELMGRPATLDQVRFIVLEQDSCRLVCRHARLLLCVVNLLNPCLCPCVSLVSNFVCVCVCIYSWWSGRGILVRTLPFSCLGVRPIAPDVVKS